MSANYVNIKQNEGKVEEEEENTGQGLGRCR